MQSPTRRWCELCDGRGKDSPAVVRADMTWYEHGKAIGHADTDVALCAECAVVARKVRFGADAHCVYVWHNFQDLPSYQNSDKGEAHAQQC